MEDDFPETCTLHDRDLIEGVVPVFYGFLVTSPESGRAWRELYRYSRSWEPGGCSMVAGRPRTRTVHYCPECREAERAWLAQQIREKPDETSWEWFLAGVLGVRDSAVSSQLDSPGETCGG